MGVDCCSQRCQCGVVTRPLKRRWALMRPCFVQGQPELDGCPVGKVIGCQPCPLDDRAVDGHRLAPPGVDWGMDPLEAGIALMQALPRGFAARRRAVVHHPAQAGSGTRRCLGQDLVDQPPTRLEAGRRLTPTHDGSPAHLPGGQIWPRTPARILVLDAGRSAWNGGPRRLAAAARWDAGLLVGTEQVILGAEGRALPGAAYTSSIGPACSATWGSRGTIQDVYRQGGMASVASLRHTGRRRLG